MSKSYEEEKQELLQINTDINNIIAPVFNQIAKNLELNALYEEESDK